MRENEIYFSVDIEASGPIPGEYSMLSLGACRVDFPEKTFYSELQPISDRFVPAALEVSKLKLKELADTGQRPEEAMRLFRKWVSEEARTDKAVFVGFNAGFDWAFVNWYFHIFLGENPFGVSALDIKAYYMGLTGCSWEETKSSKLPELLNPRRAEGHRHNALADAVHQAEIFRRMLEFRAQLMRA
jgi:DNA polymerase III epsilon subunit-like protein